MNFEVFSSSFASKVLSSSDLFFNCLIFFVKEKVRPKSIDIYTDEKMNKN